jgi:hypothetical protein
MAYTPIPGLTFAVVSSGAAVTVFNANPNGGFIQNPLLATDQGIANAEPLLVTATGDDPALSANGTTFAIQPGEKWNVIPGQTTVTKVTATTAGHKFSAVSY